MLGSSTIEKVWQMRVDGIRRRKPTWILQSAWIPPILLPILAMQAHFSPEAGLASLFTAAAFLTYSMLAYLYWRHRAKQGTSKSDKGTILIVLGYDGLALVLFSAIFLAASLQSLHGLPHQTGKLGLAILGVWFAMVVVVSIRGKAMLRYIAHHLDRPLPPEMKWLLGIPTGLIGAGVALGAVLQATPIAGLLITAVSALISLLLIPFAILTLYQIPLFLIWQPPQMARS